jgi:hypothetical protein
VRRLSPFERLVLFVMTYLVIPGFGLYLAVNHPPASMIPLIAGMLGTPLVGPGRGGGDDPPEQGPDRSDLPPRPRRRIDR